MTIKSESFKQIAELFDWNLVKPYIGEPLWYRDEQTILLDEIEDQLIKEIEELQKRVNKQRNLINEYKIRQEELP